MFQTPDNNFIIPETIPPLNPDTPVTRYKSKPLPSVYAEPGGTSLLKRRPRFFWATASLEDRYLSAAICSVRLCCSTLPASPDALAGAFALSRIVSCKLSDIPVAILRLKMWSSICRNTRYPCRLTEKREDFFDSDFFGYLLRRRFCISVKLICDVLRVLSHSSESSLAVV